MVFMNKHHNRHQLKNMGARNDVDANASWWQELLVYIMLLSQQLMLNVNRGGHFKINKLSYQAEDFTHKAEMI